MTDRSRAPAARGDVDSRSRRAGHDDEPDDVSSRPPRPGSNDHAARVVAERMQRLGYSPLECQFMAEAARYGRHGSWLTYKRQAQLLVSRRGRAPHPESVGRIARNLKREGVNVHRRIVPGARPPGATRSTGHGTTTNRPNYRALGLTAPKFRGERTREAQRTRRLHALEPARRAFAPPDRRSATADEIMASRLAVLGVPPPPPGPPRRSAVQAKSWSALELDAVLDELDGTTVVVDEDEQSRGPPE